MLSFGAAISACAHSHHWRSALQLLELNAADVVGYNGAVDACAQAWPKVGKGHPDFAGPEGWQSFFFRKVIEVDRS